MGYKANLPKAVLEELKTLVDSGMEISQETLMGLASFIDDVKAELEKIQTEKEENEKDSVVLSMFGNQVQQNGKDGEK